MNDELMNILYRTVDELDEPSYFFDEDSLTQTPQLPVTQQLLENSYVDFQNPKPYDLKLNLTKQDSHWYSRRRAIQTPFGASGRLHELYLLPCSF